MLYNFNGKNLRIPDEDIKRRKPSVKRQRKTKSSMAHEVRSLAVYQKRENANQTKKKKTLSKSSQNV